MMNTCYLDAHVGRVVRGCVCVFVGVKEFDVDEGRD